MAGEEIPSGGVENVGSTDWDSLRDDQDKKPQWDPRLTAEQIEELTAEGITPDAEEYTPALYNYGLKPIAEQADQKEPQWHPGLTPEQIDDMIQKGIDKPEGPEYEQALKEFGLKPIAEQANQKEPQWDPRLTPEQIDDLRQRDIYEPVGEEYRRALIDFGLGDPNGKDPNGKNPNKVDITAKLEGIEQEFDEDKQERIKEIEGKLEKMLPEIAELYAKNRNLFTRAKDRAEFVKIRGEYGKLLDEYLRLKAGESYEEGKREIGDRLGTRVEELTKEIEEKLTEFCGGDIEHSTKTQEEVDAEKARLVEEAEQKLREEYGEMVDALKTKINADFVEDFVAEQLKLENATTDKLDNGTLCRKFVNKVINNKKLKTVLLVAGIAGLAISGFGVGAGLAAGTMAATVSFTAGGVAAGAAKGALSGILTSRQNSKNSAVRGFADEEKIKKDLEGIDVTDKNSDISNVTDYLMGQYGEANKEDKSSNRKKTLISATIGGVLGGAMSGIHINNVTETKESVTGIIGHNPDEIHAANLDKVNIPKGHGAWDTFSQLGGDPKRFQEFQDLMWEFDNKYGLVPGSNGEVPGFNGAVGKFAHTYPGHIKDWPAVARSYITEVADAAAARGLIPADTIAGGPIYGLVEKTAQKIVPNVFYNIVAQATAYIGAAGVGVLAGRGETVRYKDNGKPGEGGTPESGTPEGATPEGGAGEESAPEGNTPENGTPEGATPEGGTGGGSEGGSSESTPEGGKGGDIEPGTAEGSTPPEGGAGEGSAPGGSTPENGTQEGGAPEGETSENEKNKDAEFEQRVKEELGGLIGGEGVNIMTAIEDSNYMGQSVFDVITERWWNNLNDEAKEAVRNFEKSLDDSERENNLLKTWLSNRGEL